MSNGDVAVPPTDLTTAAIEAVNLILSQLGLSPLDIILGLFSGKPKNEDTENVIWAYNQSAYWPLHALAANLAMALRNGAPISDSRPAIQLEFGTWKKGTVESIQGFAGVEQGQSGPGYWTLLSLINQSWGASGSGRQAVLQFVKAIDAITIVLSQQTTTPPPPPPGPPPPPPPPFTPPPHDGGNDELGILGEKILAELTVIAGELGNVSGAGGSDPNCCAKVVGELTLITTQLTAIAFGVADIVKAGDSVGAVGAIAAAIDTSNGFIKQLAGCVCALEQNLAGGGVDLGKLVAAVTSTRDVLATFEKCVCDALTTGGGTDVSGIVEQLKIANAQAIIPAAFIDALVSRGAIAPELGQLFSDRPWVEGMAAAVGGLFGASPTDVEAGLSAFGNSILALMRPLWEKFLAFINEYEPKIAKAAGEFVTAHGKTLTTIADELLKAGEALPVAGAGTVFDWAFRQLRAGGDITPENVEDRALQFYGLAWLIGQGVHLLSELAGYLKYPASSVWAKNAELLIDLLKFEPLVHALHGAFFPVAIGQPATYRFNKEFRPHLPTAGQAAELYSRRKITPAELDTLYAYNGFNQSWVNRLVSISYRPMSPMMLAAGFANADVDMAKLQDTLEYMGIRPDDLALAEQAVITRSLQQTRQALVNESVTAYGQGVVSDDELAQILTDAGYGKSASKLVMQRALIARRITLARESEAYLVPEVTQGLITADEGLQALEAAGVQPWQAQLKVTLAETRAALTQARKALAAERKLELQRQRNLTRAAIAEYERGTIDEPGLTAALTALGLDPALIITIVAVENAKRAGRLKLVFGQLLAPGAAKLLEDQVAALETQFKKQLIDEPALRAQLTALNVDAPELEALVARWAAARAGATKTGYALPV